MNKLLDVGCYRAWQPVWLMIFSFSLIFCELAMPSEETGWVVHNRITKPGKPSTL